jgi:hypothetical protein
LHDYKEAKQVPTKKKKRQTSVRMSWRTYMFSLTHNVVFCDDHSIEIRNKLILLLKSTYVISLKKQTHFIIEINICHFLKKMWKI